MPYSSGAKHAEEGRTLGKLFTQTFGNYLERTLKKPTALAHFISWIDNNAVYLCTHTLGSYNMAATMEKVPFSTAHTDSSQVQC